MGMDVSSAIIEFRKAMDPEYSGYLGPVSSAEQGNLQMREAWRDALFILTFNISPTTNAQVDARNAFFAATAGMHLDGSVFTAALDLHARTIGDGMIGYTVTYPPNDFAPSYPFEGYLGMCTAYAEQLEAHYQKGTATIGGVTQNWS